MPLNLDYYYGSEAEQYSFYRIPKTLLTDPRYKSVSIEAKVFYGLLLDRMSLSVKNGWMDKERRVYIYFTQEDAMTLMSCGKDKATRLFRELDQNGIGLIERKKQGQGRPARIYVKNFTPPPEPGETPPAPEPPHDPPQTAENQQSRPLDSTAPQTTEKAQSAPLETSGQDSGFSAPNKTDKSNTDFSHTESSISPPAPSLAVASSVSLASPQAAKLAHCAAPALPTEPASLSPRRGMFIPPIKSPATKRSSAPNTRRRSPSTRLQKEPLMLWVESRSRRWPSYPSSTLLCWPRSRNGIRNTNGRGRIW